MGGIFLPNEPRRCTRSTPMGLPMRPELQAQTLPVGLDSEQKVPDGHIKDCQKG